LVVRVYGLTAVVLYVFLWLLLSTLLLRSGEGRVWAVLHLMLWVPTTVTTLVSVTVKLVVELQSKPLLRLIKIFIA